MVIARRLRVSGRVQGVGFRAFVHDAATSEGLQGWVRNLPDGGVEVEAQGDAEAMDRFERRVRRGPASARVDQVAVDELSPGQRWRAFEIR